MPSNKAPSYIGLLMIILILSLLSRNTSLAVLTLPLLTIVFLTSLLQSREAVSLSVQREIDPSMLGAIRPVRVALTITNLSKNSIRALEITDQLSQGLKLFSGSNQTVTNLRVGGKFTLEYQVLPYSRGLYKIGPADILWSDPLKLFVSTASLGESNALYVYPEQHPVKVRITPRKTGTWWGSTPSKRSGAGMEFYGVRDYQPGDELRSINWKATARLARIVTNEYETERAADTVLILDAGRLSGSLLDTKSILDYEAEAALAVASFLLSGGNRVGLILHGRFRHWLYPGFGTRQYLKLRDQLVLAREGDSEIPLKFLVSQLAPMILSPGSQIILVGHAFSSGLAEAIISLQSLGYDVTAILVQPYHREEGAITPASLAGRMVLMEAGETADEVQRLCPTVNWRVNEPLDQTLRRLNLWIRRPGVFAR